MANRVGPVAWSRGFTLVELLVAVSIITVLLSLLIPSLRASMEHGRTVKCQANLGTVAKGVIGYALEGDAFPITADESGKPVSWRYGGWTGAKDFWKDHLDGAYYVPTAERPLSLFMHRSPGDNERLPDFQCPSDRRSSRVGPPGLAPIELSAFEDVGTSFHLNWHWFGIQTWVPGLPPSQNRDIDRVPRGERIWWKYMQSNAARFVTLLEDPANYALANRRQADGNHGKFSKHNFGFLDGHVEFLYADTRYYQQRNWTVIDETPPYKQWRAEFQFEP